MSYDDAIYTIKNNICHVTFKYNGKNCGFDPFSANDIDMWCGDDDYNAKSVDDALNKPLFDGKSFLQLKGMIKID